MEAQEADHLTYIGDEDNCYACCLPIHRVHEKTLLDSKPYHSECLKWVRKLSIRYGNFTKF